MLFQGKDGQLRIVEHGTSGTTYYFEILFCEMDFNGPSARPRTEETLIMDRGMFDSNAHYIQSDEYPRYNPIPVSFSCRMADSTNSRTLMDILNGVGIVSGTITLVSRKGKTTIDGNTLPTFADSNKKAYDVQCLWDGTLDLGLWYKEVYFPPDQQTITESADGLRFNANGLVYGDVTRIMAFQGGTTYIQN